MENDEEYEHLPSEFYYPEERLDENSNETGVEASRTTEVDLNEITRSVSSPKKTMPYNKLLTNRACSSRTGEYWPSVVFVRTSLRSVRTATTSGQYSPVQPSRSVSNRLVCDFFY